VGKHVQRLAGYFYARLRALDQALDAAPPAPLAPMLRSSVYHGGAVPGLDQVDALAGYLLTVEAALRTQASGRLLAGEVGWASPEGPPVPTPSEIDKL
jgi:hypothetical protein